MLKKEFSQVCHWWSLAEHYAVLYERQDLRREGQQARRAERLRLQHRLRLLRVVHFLLFIPHVESVRCRHYGQFRLSHAGLVDPGRSSSRRVRPHLGRIRPKRNRQDSLHRDVRHAEEHGPTVGVRQQMPESARVQETNQDEYAGGRWRQSELYHHAIRSDSWESQYKNAMRWVDIGICVRKRAHKHETQIVRFRTPNQAKTAARDSSFSFLYQFLYTEWLDIIKKPLERKIDRSLSFKLRLIQSHVKIRRFDSFDDYASKWIILCSLSHCSRWDESSQRRAAGHDQEYLAFTGEKNVGSFDT